MNPAVIAAFITSLLFLCAQGHPAGRSSKCQCLNGYIKPGTINTRQIKGEPLVQQPTIFCPHTEIIITIAAKKKCVDPESRLGQLILRKKNRQEKKGAVSTTAASTQMMNSGSTSLHTMSKL